MCCNEPSRSHTLSISLLALAVRDSGDVGSQGFGEEQAKVSKSTDTDDSDVFGCCASSVCGQGVVESRTAT